MHFTFTTVVVAWLGIALHIAGLAIRDDNHAGDLYRPSNRFDGIANLTTGMNTTTASTNTPGIVVDEIPEAFGIEVNVKQGGKLFTDRYDIYKLFIDCAAYAGLYPWTATKLSLSCDQSASVRLAFTSNQPPKPVLQIRTILWGMYEMYDWYVSQAVAGNPKWQELSFFVWWDDDTRLGVGSVIAKPQAGSTQVESISISNTTLDDDPSPANTNSSVEVSSYSSNTSAPLSLGPDLPQSVAVSVGEVDVAIDVMFRGKGKLVCDDNTFYRQLLNFIIGLAELDAEASIPVGYMRYDERFDLTFGIQVTSKETGAEEKLLKVWIAYQAIQQLAYQMEREDRKLRFHEFDAKILTGPTGRPPTRIVGKMFFWKGKVGSSGGDELVAESDEEVTGGGALPGDVVFS